MQIQSMHRYTALALACGCQVGQAQALPEAQALRVPVSFERNVGQETPEVDFLVRSQSGALFLKANQAVWVAAGGKAQLAMNLLGASRGTGFTAEQPLPTRSHYLVGNREADWKRDVPHFAQVRQSGVYPGIDLVYHPAQDARLEYDFVVAPGADPGAIRLGFQGMSGMRLNDRGDLILSLADGEVVQRAPLAFQDGPAGPVAVPAAFRFNDDGSVGFQVAAHDAGKPLVIDPVLTFSSYLGDALTSIKDVKVVDNGAAYLYGHTAYTGLPTASGVLQPLPAGGTDAFIAKLAPDASYYEFVTYLGGTGEETNGGSIGAGIHVDSGGAMYVTGRTTSVDFPLKNPLQPNLVGQSDFYVAKLDPAGSRLIYSTYLGGPDLETPTGSVPSESGPTIAVDRTGNAYILGYTEAPGFPVANAYMDHPMGGLDGLLSKLDARGANLLFSTYFGGTGDDKPRAMKLDGAGNVFITGRADSPDFPLLNPLQNTYRGRGDVFVSKFDSSGQLAFSTLWGGASTEKGRAIDLDARGNLFVTGNTQSTNFPAVSALQSQLAGGGDMFLLRINSTLDRVVYSTYIGGSDDDEGSAMVVDAQGNVFVSGYTHSTDFPLVKPVQTSLSGVKDAVVLKINNRGTRLLYSTYLGGTGDEESIAMGINTSGVATIVGSTTSADFPLLNPLQGDAGGVFVSRIAP
ncbi:MAG: SBBP repeat-containing protein [Pseudomonadota bacterium]